MDKENNREKKNLQYYIEKYQNEDDYYLNSQLSPTEKKNIENFFQEQNVSLQDDQKIEDELMQIELDQEMFLQQIKCIDEDQEFETFLEIDEIKSYISEEINYKQLYIQMKKKCVMGMKIIKKFVEEQSQQQDFLQVESEYLNKGKLLRKEINLINSELKEVTDKLKKANLEIQQLKATKFTKLTMEDIKHKSLQELDLLQLQMNDNLNKISNRKSEIILEYQSKLAQLQIKKSLENNLCIVCQIKKANQLIRPCNHICLCEDCVSLIEECPLDRKYILDVEKVFIDTV